MNLLKFLDFFSKPKPDVYTSTRVGGLFSILGMFLSFLFLILEFPAFQEVRIVKEFTVKNNPWTRKERVNIDITFPKAPCDLLTLTQVEEGGEPINGIFLQKERISHMGKKIGKFTPVNDSGFQNFEQEHKDLMNAIHNKEGCRMHGNFSISEIPGNFHFSFNEKIALYKKLSENDIKAVSLDFTLHHLTFGMDPNQKVILSRYPKENFTPYHNFVIENVQPNEKINIFTKIVGNYYATNNLKNQGLLAYSFTANYQKREISPLEIYLQQIRKEIKETSTLQINYTFSPINIFHKKADSSYSKFIVDSLKVIGGIFSIMKVLNKLCQMKF